jgi:hypothetical protein
VGTYFGGAVGAAVGSAVGAAVGSFVYGAGDAIASGLDPNAGAGDAPLFMQHVRHVVAIVGLRAAQLLRLLCSTSIKEEIAALQRWGAPISDNGYMSQEVAQAISAAVRGTVPPGGGPAGVARAQPLVAAFQKAIFAANAARVAECETAKKQALSSAPSKSSSSGALPVVIGAAAIAGVAWWLLA